MSEARSSKKGVRRNSPRKVTGGSTPNRELEMAACGHSACSSRCHVRYVGAVSHIRDHHALHAARGIANIWTAVVITGLAVVVTGAVAFSSVEAKSVRQNVLSQGEFMRMLNRMELMEKTMHEMREVCGNKTPEGEMVKIGTPTEKVSNDAPAKVKIIPKK